jgi:peptide/nickel transport system substrate-binding protein
VGLGPYRLEELGTGTITAVRFEDYFDPSDSGYLDRIRWRVLGDDQAFTALEAGDLDFCDRISSERFFGPATQSAAMARRYYRGYSYQGVFTFFAWNMRQPPFDDERVRLAMAHCFDLEAFKHSYYHGLVNVVTGPFPYFSSAYAHDVAPPALDFARAEELLALAGWYDRDGDGRVDRDGRALAFDLLLPAGNEASKQNGLVLQEGLRRVGVECRLAVLDWVPLQKRYSERDFEATALAWVPDVETDPEPNWHSRWAAPEVAGSNAVGMADAEVDRLIAAGQAELDPARRAAIWRDLHRRIAQLQPFLFQYNPPRKFLMNRALRGHQTSRIDPGYVIRRWYYPEGTPGTRALEARRR